MTDQLVRVFISYSWGEGDDYRLWVKRLAVRLRADGVDAMCDAWMEDGVTIPDFMNREVRKADKVLLLCSPTYRTKVHQAEEGVRQTGSGWELGLLTSAIFAGAVGKAKVLPALARGEWTDSAPDYLLGLPYVDLRDEETFEQDYSRLLTRITVGPEKPPPLGLPPDIRDTSPVQPLRGPAVERYLTAIKEQNSYLDIRGMGAQVTERMELAQVYTRLLVSTPDREAASLRRTGRGKPKDTERDDIEGALRTESHRELRDVLADHPHAVLIGDPGSGKTTFLRYVAQNLARAQLGEAEALQRIGLAEPAFPIFARLAEVARFLTEHPDTSCGPDAPEHLYRYLQHLLAGYPYGLPQDYLRRRVLQGGCLLLLDGLDEVPGEAMRRRLARIIEAVVIAGKAVANRHLITCRTRAYQDLVQLTGDVAMLRLAPLEREQVEQFVDGWSRALFRVASGEPDAPRAREAADYRDDLLRAIAENPSGATFSQSPLMLTVLAVVHWNQKRLPEQRAELYESAVTYLLESRKEHSNYPPPLRRECLQAVAIAMFQDAEGVQRTLDRRDAAKVVAPVLSVKPKEAEDFLENEELVSGLLVSRTEGEVEFWHLTFQEYLAALELSQQGENGWSQVSKHLHQDRWSEVVLLLAGCERRQGGLRAARRMIQRILDTGTDTISRARAVGLVGRILRDIRAYGGEPEQGTTYEAALRETLSIFEPGGKTVPEPVREEVGEALGQAGDPRLAESADNRVLIPGGTFWMGAQKTDPKAPGYDSDAYEFERPVHRVTVSALRVGRYPVTVAEFRRFLEAGEAGYLNPGHWDADGWAWRERKERTGPWGWDEQRPHPNRPVTGVAWYEAAAYCRWVGGRLPTEAEWEWVARGADGRKYPWGDAVPTPHHANFDMRVGSPSPVGIYPLDTHPHGVRDFVGNVWEWCGDWYDDYQDGAWTDPTGPDTGTSRVLRGGSFDGLASFLRSAYRIGSHPDPDYDLLGFRVVWVSAGGQE